MKNLLLGLSGVVLSASVYADKPLNAQPAYAMPSMNEAQPVYVETPAYRETQPQPTSWRATDTRPARSSLFAEYLVHKGKFENNIDADIKGFALGYSSSPHRNGLWGKFEYLKNSDFDADYFEFSFGGHKNFYSANNAYLIGTLGMGVGGGSAEGYDDSLYVSIPVGLELGFSPIRSLSVYGGVGYKWNWDISSPTTCNDGSSSNSTGSGTCSHHGGIDYYNYTIGNFDGMTYKAGLRYNF